MAINVDLKNVDIGTGELSPGATKRRWEPEGGVRRHNEKIHRESRYANEHKNLPFKFSKPPKSKRQMTVECVECGYMTHVSVNTVGMICNECKAYVSVKEV
jgi:hypothetical protein